jgi:beta-lactamase class A
VTEISLDADLPAVPASVIKVLVATEAEGQFGTGELEPHARVLLRPDERTPDPVGFSLYSDEVEVSLRDLLVPMLTISENVATDACYGASASRRATRRHASRGWSALTINKR